MPKRISKESMKPVLKLQSPSVQSYMKKYHNHGTPGAVYERFFDLLRKIYHLQGPAALTAPRPLFDTWRENVTDLPEHTEYKVIHVGSQDIADQPFEYVSETASTTSRTLDPKDPHVVPETPPQPSIA